MSSMNSVQLIGNLTRDPDLNYIGDNRTAVSSCGIAMNRRWKSGDEQREETTFVELKAWGRTAEVMNQYLAIGRQVAIEGRLTFEEWEDKDTGARRTRLYVTVEKMHLIGSRADNENGKGGGNSGDDDYTGPQL